MDGVVCPRDKEQVSTQHTKLSTEQRLNLSDCYPFANSDLRAFGVGCTHRLRVGIMSVAGS